MVQVSIMGIVWRRYALKRVRSLLSGCILGCFAVVALLLYALCLSSTAYMDIRVNETTFQIRDSPLVNLLATALFVMGLCMVCQCGRLQKARLWLASDAGYRVARTTLLGGLFAIGCVWAFVFPPTIRADQWWVHNAVVRSLAGDWGAFLPGEYLDLYPHQAGLFLIERLLVSIVGDQYFVRVFQVSNAAALVLFYAAVTGIMCEMGAGRLPRLLALALGLVFAPLWQYVTFVYGNLWCLGLTTLAVYLELEFLLDGKRTVSAVLSVVAVALALLFRESGKVVLIAMLILCPLVRRDGSSDNHAPSMLPDWLSKGAYAGALVFILLFLSAVPRSICESMSGQDLGQGASSWSYLAMGMQDGYMDCGWYNEYNASSYEEAGFNTAAQAEMAKEEIAARIHSFVQNPSSCIWFYARKVASQWNNPSFQGVWIIQAQESMPELSAFAKELVAQEFTDLEMIVLNYVQAVIVFGALAWAVLVPWAGDDSDARNATLPLVILGGFMCHVFWEAKCQYVLLYFVLLIPLAAMGYSFLVRSLVGRTLPKVEAPKVAVVVLFASLWLAFVFAGGLKAVTCDVEAFRAYLASGPVPTVLGG